MKIGFYSPYLHSLSGGEKYFLTMADQASLRHQVCVFWDDQDILDQSRKRFGLKLAGVGLRRNIFSSRHLFAKLAETKKYDLMVFLSDGSMPTTLAHRNILHFQVPFARVRYSEFKDYFYQVYLCNSRFTAEHLDSRLQRKVQIIYPPVKLIRGNTGQKLKMILNVGRFTAYHDSKKQEVIIKTFKLGVDRGFLKDYCLVLAGGLLESDREYYRRLTELIGGYRINTEPNCSTSRLNRLYQDAQIYWHAAGFGEDNPELAEHFGISTVEAMSAGCIAMAYQGGGLPEIISHGHNGFLWNTPEELLDITVRFLKTKKSDTEAIMFQAVRAAAGFSEEIFRSETDKILDNLL